MMFISMLLIKDSLIYGYWRFAFGRDSLESTDVKFGRKIQLLYGQRKRRSEGVEPPLHEDQKAYRDHKNQSIASPPAKWDLCFRNKVVDERETAGCEQSRVRTNYASPRNGRRSVYCCFSAERVGRFSAVIAADKWLFSRCVYRRAISNVE